MNPLVCPACGTWADRPRVRDGAWVCAGCGHHEPWRSPPLHVLTGPSGAGKSTVGRLLRPLLAGRAQVLEQDVLWVAGLQDPADEHAAFRGTWLRLIAMLNQAGAPPTLLCGTVVPPEFDRLPERALLGEIRYLALVCDPALLRTRLQDRPAWRGWQDEDRVADMLRFDSWLRANAEPLGITLLDTTGTDPADTAGAVAEWVRGQPARPDRQ